jgi:hypothetical protein
MKTTTRLLLAMLALACMSISPAAAAQDDALYVDVAAADRAAFDAFNQCKDPAQLQRHAQYFATDVEFYHDNGGVTWNRDQMLANTAKYVCGNFRRELVAGTLKVFQIKGFGAIAQGTHRFCQFATGKCEGEADFTNVWRFKDGKWEMTRVLSYGHRAAAG